MKKLIIFLIKIYQKISAHTPSVCRFSPTCSEYMKQWFKKGVEAALIATTDVNQQKFSFEYVGMKNNQHIVKVNKGFSLIGYTKMDLGIAKYQHSATSPKMSSGFPLLISGC